MLPMHVEKLPLQRRRSSKMHGWCDWLWIVTAEEDGMTIVKTLPASVLSLDNIFYRPPQSRPTMAQMA